MAAGCEDQMQISLMVLAVLPYVILGQKENGKEGWMWPVIWMVQFHLQPKTWKIPDLQMCF